MVRGFLFIGFARFEFDNCKIRQLQKMSKNGLIL